jgi:hypothetical protein
LLAAAAIPGGSKTYLQGRVVCTSGGNAGLQRTITSWDGVSTFQVQYPWPFAIAVGDGFAFYPGCDKSMGSGGCSGFNNLVNFGGQPWTPAPELQIG